MRLYVAATGSAANTYVLSGSGGESLILDAGVALKKVAPHVPNLRKIAGVLLTHEHGDHARYIGDYILRGHKCYASKGTWDALSARGLTCMPLLQFEAGPFKVMPFETEHDAAEPFGYLIRYQPTGELVLYATDTYYLRYTFPQVNYWLMECNYCEDLIDAETDLVLRNRLKESHMSLRRLKDALKANSLTDAAKIVLLHLSDSRSDEARMVREITEQTGVDTVAASAGMEIELERVPF